MCGINGIHAYHYAANSVDRRELILTRDHMASRGPDGAGLYLSHDGRLGLGHRRLSIIDLSEAGSQPMTSEDGRYTVTFNGEIYNWREIRARLEAKGSRFRSQSDTEVLLHLFADRGVDMLSELSGMFAFAIWDERERRLFLARDPYGIKPLYWADDGWTFRFASQVKALAAGGRIPLDPDCAGWTGFYLLGSVPEPFTTLRSVRALEAGCMMIVDARGPHDRVRYHSIAAVHRDAEAGDARNRRGALTGDEREAAREALLTSVRQHLVADVPVGAFLSAGVDSGALVGLMRDAGVRDIETVTIAFEEFAGSREDEAPLAQMVAQAYGTRHSTRIVTCAEFEADLPGILAAMDQPSIDGINTWLVSKAARERGMKVVISGLGGDELFGGYPSFRDIPRWVAGLCLPGRVPLLGRLVRDLAVPVMQRLKANPKTASMVEYGGTYAGAYLLKRGLYLPWELSDVLDRQTIESGLRRLRPLDLIASTLAPMPASGFAKVATLESSLYMRNQLLRDTDWASMAHSIEVRVPLVDSRLLAQLAPVTGRLSPGEGKRLLAGAPTQPLPDAITTRRKTGFTTPVGSWMRSLMEVGNGKDRRRPIAGPSTPWARDWSQYIGAELAQGAIAA